MTKVAVDASTNFKASVDKRRRVVMNRQVHVQVRGAMPVSLRDASVNTPFDVIVGMLDGIGEKTNGRIRGKTLAEMREGKARGLHQSLQRPKVRPEGKMPISNQKKEIESTTTNVAL